MIEKNGFSLIEMMVVIVLIIMLASLTTLGLMQWSSNAKINEYRDMILSDIQFARSKSITSVPYAIVFSNSNYLLCQLNDTNNNLQRDNGETYTTIKTVQLPNGMTMTYNNGTELWFDRKGLPRTSNWALGMGTITITYDNLTRTITISSTGKIQYEQ